MPMTQCLSVVDICDEMVHHRLVQGLYRVGQIRQVGVPNQLPAEMSRRYFGWVGLCTWDTSSVYLYCLCDTSQLSYLHIRVSRGPFVFDLIPVIAAMIRTKTFMNIEIFIQKKQLHIHNFHQAYAASCVLQMSMIKPHPRKL
jgi:hypothetical protein